MAQKGRKDSKIMSFLIRHDLLALVDASLARQQANTRLAPLSGRSEWIIRAITRELDHQRRSRRSKRNVHRTETTNDHVGKPTPDALHSGGSLIEHQQLRSGGARPGDEGRACMGSGAEPISVSSAVVEGGRGVCAGGEARPGVESGVDTPLGQLGV